MAKNEKSFYIFNPYTMLRLETNYEELMRLTGRSRASLASMKNRRHMISGHNLYVLPKSITIKELRDIAGSIKIEDEIWINIPGHAGYYISNYGRVKSDGKGKINFMIPFINRAGYMAVRIKVDGRYYTYPVHRMVADAFIPKTSEFRPFYIKTTHKSEDELTCVVHINSNKFDNRADNLVWLSPNDIAKVKKKKTIAVIKIDPITKSAVDFYESLVVAGRENFISPEAIGNCVSGRSLTSGGYKWMIDDNSVFV